MPRMMRVLLAAVAAILTLGLTAVSANATTPANYATSAGTGMLSTRTILGTSSCRLFNVTGSITGGTSGSITSFDDRSCLGVLTDIVSSLAITILIDLSVRPPVIVVHLAGVTIRNILGGTCLYFGLLVGTGATGTGNASVSGSLNLDSSRSSGFCTNPADVILDMSFPGLTF